MRLQPLLILACTALLSACHDGNDVASQPEPIPAGAMAYVGYDERGTKIVEGWVKFDFASTVSTPDPPVDVTGTWKLHRLPFAGEVGPQVGEGTLEGLLESANLYVNFNPGQADDNVVAEGTLAILDGPMDGMRWSGSWSWVTLQGTRRHGTFSAAN